MCGGKLINCSDGCFNSSFDIELNHPPKMVQDREEYAIKQDSLKYVFVSYSHNDIDIVYKDLNKLWELNANFWYDKGFLINPTKNWDDIAKDKILDDNCVGAIFYVSKNSFLSDAVYNEVTLCIEKQKKTPLFDYKIVMIGGDNIFEIQNCCNINAQFTSERLINLHQIWGSEKIVYHYRSDNEHIYNVIKWMNSIGCIDDLRFEDENRVIVRSDYVIMGNTLVSYYGKTKKFKIDETDSKLIKRIKNIASSTLEYIEIPEGVVQIDDFAIISCTSLKELILPSSLERLSLFSISNFNFSSIQVKCNPNFEVDSNGFLYSKKRGKFFELMASPNKKNVRKLDINDSVEIIKDFSISCCDNLEEIKFSKNLKEIGYWAIKECKNLKKITLYPSIIHISKEAFYMTDLTQVELVYIGEETEFKLHKINKYSTLHEYFKDCKIIFKR